MRSPPHLGPLLTPPSAPLRKLHRQLLPLVVAQHDYGDAVAVVAVQVQVGVDLMDVHVAFDAVEIHDDVAVLDAGLAREVAPIEGDADGEAVGGEIEFLALARLEQKPAPGPATCKDSRHERSGLRFQSPDSSNVNSSVLSPR